jgi:hypothetical protein
LIDQLVCMAAERFSVPLHAIPKSKSQSHGIDRRRIITLSAAGPGALALQPLTSSLRPVQ